MDHSKVCVCSLRNSGKESDIGRHKTYTWCLLCAWLIPNGQAAINKTLWTFTSNTKYREWCHVGRYLLWFYIIWKLRSWSALQKHVLVVPWGSVLYEKLDVLFMSPSPRDHGEGNPLGLGYVKLLFLWFNYRTHRAKLFLGSDFVLKYSLPDTNKTTHLRCFPDRPIPVSTSSESIASPVYDILNYFSAPAT